jgi:hypothetical protein
MRELLEDNGVPGFSMVEMFKKAYVDLTKPLPPPPLAISIGTYEFRQQRVPIRFGTYGNFSSIVGDSKSKKTFLKSMVMAGYIGGNSSNHAPDLVTHRKGDQWVLDFDTEQGKYDSQWAFKRVEEMVGYQYANYKAFTLRQFPHRERVEFIEWVLMESEYRGNIGLVSIDGFADLISETNDQERSNDLIQKLMYWTDVTQCHLTGIIHTVSGGSKATGHLGSSIQKKSETVALLEVDENDPTITNVRFTYNRGFPLDKFSFTVGKDGLPKVITGHEAPF